jgi:hypothetical protein
LIFEAFFENLGGLMKNRTSVFFLAGCLLLCFSFSGCKEEEYLQQVSLLQNRDGTHEKDVKAIKKEVILLKSTAMALVQERSDIVTCNTNPILISRTSRTIAENCHFYNSSSSTYSQGFPRISTVCKSDKVMAQHGNKTYSDFCSEVLSLFPPGTNKHSHLSEFCSYKHLTSSYCDILKDKFYPPNNALSPQRKTFINIAKHSCLAVASAILGGFSKLHEHGKVLVGIVVFAMSEETLLFLHYCGFQVF